MRVDVAAALKSPGEHMLFEVSGDVPLSDESQGIALCSPVTAWGVVFGAEGLLRVQGQLQATLRAACSRCLTPFSMDVSIAFDERFAKSEGNKGDSEQEDFYPYSEAALDLSGLVRDMIWLQMPIAPVCREDCKGLCPVCGADRNTTPCGCA